jgi:hypothetical protein
MHWRLDNVLFLIAVILATIVATLELQPRPAPPASPFVEERRASLIESGRVPTPVPQAWHRFGQLFQDRLKARLEASTAEAEAVRNFLKAQVGRAKGPRSTLLVRVWIGPDGKVRHVDFPALADRQADMALRRLLVQGDNGRPPADMPQPLILKLALDW